jgi:hypothetical protein
MSVEVVIPSLRQEPAETLVWSLSQQTHPPDVVTVVSNETQPFANPGVKVRLLRFESSEYGVGDLDVALRQNVGIWQSECDVVIIQGDDQIAPPTMVEDTLEALSGKDYIWGNHRLVNWDLGRDEIRVMPMEQGLSRENPPPPMHHGYQSCYGGMFGASTGFLQDVGGFDMAFNGRHGSEDQALGYRLMRRANENQVLIVEPPFSWHPIELKNGDGRVRSPWLNPVTNGCGSHLFEESTLDGVSYLRCVKCPVWRFNGDGQIVLREEVLIRYRHELVSTTSVWL